MLPTFAKDRSYVERGGARKYFMRAESSSTLRMGAGLPWLARTFEEGNALFKMGSSRRETNFVKWGLQGSDQPKEKEATTSEEETAH